MCIRDSRASPRAPSRRGRPPPRPRRVDDRRGRRRRDRDRGDRRRRRDRDRASRRARRHRRASASVDRAERPRILSPYTFPTHRHTPHGTTVQTSENTCTVTTVWISLASPHPSIHPHRVHHESRWASNALERGEKKYSELTINAIPNVVHRRAKSPWMRRARGELIYRGIDSDSFGRSSARDTPRRRDDRSNAGSIERRTRGRVHRIASRPSHRVHRDEEARERRRSFV